MSPLTCHCGRVSVSGETSAYTRVDTGVAIRFCPVCGVTTHFVLTPAAVARHGNVRTGVNMRLADERDLAGVELRFPYGQAWGGEGPFGYVREAMVIGG